jgi:hypothetical protein
MLSETFDSLQAAVEKYLVNEVCTSDCDAMVLGSLTIKMSKLGILTTPPAPYSGFSNSGLFSYLRPMFLSSECAKMGRRYKSSTCKRLTLTLRDTLDSFQAGIAPVTLEWKAQWMRPGRKAWVLKVRDK